MARVLVKWTPTRRPDSRTKRIARRYRVFPPSSVVFSTYSRERARKSSRVVPAPAPDAWTAHGLGARRAARGLRADSAARRPGTRGVGSPDRLRSRPGGRLPPRARLPDEAHRVGCDGGRGALRRSRIRARPPSGARRGPPQAPRLAPGRAPGTRRACGTALPRRYARLVPRGGPRSAPARHRRSALARATSGDALSRGGDRGLPPARPARPRAQGRGLVPAR